MPIETAFDPSQVPLTVTAERKLADRERDRLSMAKVVAGDQAALDDLMNRWSKPVYSLALRIARKPELAEEITQDVFFKVWKNAAIFEGQRGAFSSWVLTMAHHGAIDALRRQKARGSQVTNTLDNVLAATLRSPREGVSGWQRLKLEEALASLPDKQREAVELAYFEGLSRDEMATRLGEPVGTVKTRLRDAILRLAKVFQDPEAALQSVPELRS